MPWQVLSCHCKLGTPSPSGVSGGGCGYNRGQSSGDYGGENRVGTGGNYDGGRSGDMKEVRVAVKAYHANEMLA
ncbi:hypothetical protein PS2_013312 [Malus domestica]